MKGLSWNVRNREVSDLQRCPLVQVLLYICKTNRINLISIKAGAMFRF